MSIETILFYFLGSSAIASAVLVVMMRNPIMSAISLVANFFCIAALYLLLQAQFLAVIQIIVYTGAIMVLVIFVIMLLNLGDEKQLREKTDWRKVAGSILLLGFLLEMLYIFGFRGETSTFAVLHPDSVGNGELEAIGKAMFTTFLLPVEIVGLLLLVAIVGAIILAKKRT